MRNVKIHAVRLILTLDISFGNSFDLYITDPNSHFLKIDI